MAKPLKILYFGSYDPEYPYNSILISGLRQNGVDVIECQDDSPGLKKFIKLFFKHWSLRNDYDAMVVGFLGQVIMPLAKLITRKPVIFSAPVSLYDANVRDRKVIKPISLKAAYYWFLDWFSMRLADLVFCGTNQDIEYAAGEFHIRKEKFRRMLIGAEDNIFYPVAAPGKKDYFLVSFHGTFIPVQGVEFIVEAAKILESENIKFLIIGSGQEKQNTLDLARRLSVKNVEFLGLLPKKQLASRISQADLCLGIFGNTPRTQRAIPFKIYECLAMRKPVITADTPAARELFDEKELMLVKAADPQSLADGILRLKNNPEILANLAQNGYNKFIKLASPKVLGGTLKDIIIKLIQ
ncbi:MAG: glycosyltransferase [Candidatus Azambacteria bacterium]|nr:glycosyltransferase [Candidatus Azambacteria bacterium]